MGRFIHSTEQFSTTDSGGKSVQGTNTVADRFQRDPAFANAIIDEVAELHRNAEPGIARAVLLQLVAGRS